MTRMTRPDCAVMCNLINTHTHTHTHTHTPWEDQCEWHRMTRVTWPDCAVMCNLINTHTHTHTYTHTSPLPLAMSTCGEVVSDVHALIKELAIRRVEYGSETHSNESQHLVEGTEVARLRRRFSFVLQQAILFCFTARVTISADRGWRLRVPDSSVRKARCLYKRIVPRG